MNNRGIYKMFAGLLVVIGSNLVLLLDRYTKYEAPIGWDTPLYIYMVKLIDERGIHVFIQETSYLHFYSLFEFFIFKLLIHDPFLIEKIVPITVNLSIISLVALITLELFQEPNLSLLAAFFTGTSANLIRMTSDLHRSLFGYVFVLSTLLFAYELYMKLSSKRLVMLLTSFLLLVITHIETAFFVLLMILISESIMAKTRKLGNEKSLLIVLSPSLLLMVLFFLFYPYSFVFLTHSVSIFKWHMFNMSLTMINIEYFLQLLGGVTIPFVILGMYECVKLAKNKELKGLVMATYCFTPLILAPFLLGLCERALLLFPNGILAALGFSSVYRHATQLKINMKASKNSSRKTKRFGTVLGSAALISVLALQFFMATVLARQWLIPFIDEKTYQDLQWLSTHEMSKTSIIVMQFPDNPWADPTLRLYRNWVKATIGDHFVYVGKLYCLLHGYRTSFLHESFNKFSIETWNELMQSNVLNNLSEHPVIIVDEFYRSPLTPYEKVLLDEVRQGVYMLRRDYVNFTTCLYSVRIIPYLDFYACYKCYSIEREWATTGWVLETYDENPRERFYASYRTLLFSNISYELRLRLLDVAPSFAPVEVVLDNAAICKISYNGTGQIMEITVALGEAQTGFHDLTLRIVDIAHAHMLSLDYIEIVPVG